MKKLLIIACCIALFSCTKMKVDEPAFEVTVDKTTVQKGEEVVFHFTGNPDNIVFYSGKAGANYSQRNRSSGNGIPQLNFTSYLQNAGEENTLKLLISTDYTGDSANIGSATWIDITDRAILSTGTDKTSSGNIDLSEFASLNKPVYFAFRYQGYKDAVKKQPTWTIRTFNVENFFEDGYASPNALIDQLGWRAYNVSNPTVGWSISITSTGGTLSINGTGSGSVNEDNDDWLVTRAVDLRNAKPDVGTPIRSLNTVPLLSYPFTYDSSGTYKATFLAFNKTVDEEKAVVREVTITVE